jgi:biotin synthase
MADKRIAPHLRTLALHAGQEPDVDYLLHAPLLELVAHADKVRREAKGCEFELCNIVNAKSGLCGEDCKFCAQSAHHSCNVPTYPLKRGNEIHKAAEDAWEMGADHFGIVTSGNRLGKEELDSLAEAISDIRSKIGIRICASLGALRASELSALKDAGLSRYQHNIETSRRYYPHIVSTHEFDQRLATIQAATNVGLEVCSGGIIGMGETWQDRIAMARLLKKLDVDSVPVNLLVPIEGTAMGSLEPISCVDAVRTICIFRIILPKATIKVAAGRETVLKDFQSQAFMAGANGMLIGGYLTVGGRSPAEDHKLVAQVQEAWAQ